MKLISIITRKYALFSFIALLGGLAALYVFLLFHIEEETNERLISTRDHIVKDLASGKNIEYWPYIIVTECGTQKEQPQTDKISDTLMDARGDGDWDSFRQITSIRQINSKHYKIIIRTHIPELGEWWFSMGAPISGLLLAILIIVTTVILRYNSTLWKPFYKIIENMKVFSVSDARPIRAVTSEVDEFRELNASAIKLMNELRHEFERQREFIGNASHELQTPLAIIKAKTEALLQNGSLTADDAAKLQVIYDTTNRLSRINKSLNLILKIDSPAFSETQSVNLKDYVLGKVTHFEEIAADRGISFDTQKTVNTAIVINIDLLDVLITNLLTNAVNYNVRNGKIIIELSGAMLRIANTGIEPKNDTALMFERFMKDDPAEKSTGLGLSIVRQICDRYAMPTRYVFKDGWHDITIYLQSE